MTNTPAGPPSEGVINQVVRIIRENATDSDDAIASKVISTMRLQRVELEPRAVYEIIAEVRTQT